MHSSINIAGYRFSKHLFWDVDYTKIDLQKNAPFVIKKILLYGFFSDWQTMFKLYERMEVLIQAKKMRELDLKTACYISLITDTPITEFECYIIKQSSPQHWNF